MECLRRTGALPVFIPAPSDIWAEVQRNPGLLIGNLGPTLSKALTGYAIAAAVALAAAGIASLIRDRKSTRLNSSHQIISYAVFCLKKKKKKMTQPDRRQLQT